MIAPLLFATWQVSLDAILDDPKLKGATVAAMVTDLDGHPLYQRNPTLRVVPGSNQKLLTSVFALNTLGPLYQPVTKIWKLVDRTVVDSPGDPLLSYRVLTEAKSRLRLNRYLPVYAREAYSPGVPPTWEFDDLPNKYAAAVNALTVDRGSFELWNNQGRAELRPDPYGMRIDRVITPDAPRIVYDPRARRLQVFGTLPEKEERLDTLAVPRPDEAVARILGANLVTTDKLPDWEPNLIIKGSPLSEMLRACLPPSDNNIAEHLLLIAARHQGPWVHGEYPDAEERLTAFLTGPVGLDKDEVHVVDGSGISRHNLVTVHALTSVLAWANHQPTAGVLRSALARPGVGTLSNRLQGVVFEGKTGSLDMVIALSGYVHLPDGSERIVSIVMNHFLGTANDARGIADAFVRQVSQSNALQ